MLASIYRVELIEEEVEIPDTCPHCGASFLSGSADPDGLTEENNLVEWRIEDTAVATTADEEADVDDDIEESGEQVFITGYQCRVCKNAIHESDIAVVEDEDEALGGVVDVG